MWLLGLQQAASAETSAGFTVDSRVCAAIEDLSPVVGELWDRADGIIAATHGLAAPLIAAVVAVVVAWMVREAWRGINDAPIAVIAVGLAAVLGAVVALWPGQHSCGGMPWVTLLATPLGILIASAVLVGYWRRPSTPAVMKVGLAAMALGVVLNLVLARAGLGNLAAYHAVAAAVVGGVGVAWLTVSGVREASVGRRPTLGGKVESVPPDADEGSGTAEETREDNGG